MWTTILGLLPSIFTSLNSIAGAIANERIAALNATTDQARIVAEENVAMLTAKRDLMIADSQRSSLDIWVRASLAFPIVFILNKVFVYDKGLGLGTTDKFDPLQWQIVMAVIGFYFLYTGAITLARIIKA